MNNLIVAYDLITPGQDYEPVRTMIRSLGSWYQLQYSLFFVQTNLTEQQAYNRIRPLMDANDKLLVANATSACLGDYPVADFQAVKRVWEAA